MAEETPCGLPDHARLVGVRALPSEAVVTGWQRCFDAPERSSRPEIWLFTRAHAQVRLLSAFLFIVSNRLRNRLALEDVASIVPSIPKTVRRLRDARKHGAWIVITLGPLIGGIWLPVLLLQPPLGEPTRPI